MGHTRDQGSQGHHLAGLHKLLLVVLGLLFRFFALGNVPGNASEPYGLAFRIPDQGDGVFSESPCSVLSDQFPAERFSRIPCPVNLIEGLKHVAGRLFPHEMLVTHTHEFIS